MMVSLSFSCVWISTVPADAVGFTSLEELLDASGINNLDGVPSSASDHHDSERRMWMSSVCVYLVV